MVSFIHTYLPDAGAISTYAEFLLINLKSYQVHVFLVFMNKPLEGSLPNHSANSSCKPLEGHLPNHKELAL